MAAITIDAGMVLYSGLLLSEKPVCQELREVSITEQEYAEILRRQGRPKMSHEITPPAPAKRNKFNAKKTEVDNITFDSKREATRYQELKIAERCGVISDLRLQVPYALRVNEMHICSYRADFQYLENGELIIEDAKGVRTREYQIKRALMKAIYGIEIRET